MSQRASAISRDVYPRKIDRPRPPVIVPICCLTSSESIVNGYLYAYQHAKAGIAVLDAIARLRSEKARAAAWAHPVRGRASATAARWFGPYSLPALSHLRRVFTIVLSRFTHGYRTKRGFQTARFVCLNHRHQKCRDNVLANASIYGTIRVCPSLLSRSSPQIGLVILHEMFHQLGRVRDQRDPICGRGRCYGVGALRLVQTGQQHKVLNNNDNLAQFAFFATQALIDRQRGIIA